MRAFSQLLDDLTYTRSRNSKLKLIGEYLKETPDPDRGIALAALTGTLDIAAVKPAQIRAMAEERIDPILLYMSRDYVGDMAETVSLLWPNPEGERCELDDGTLRISDIVERLRTISRSDAPGACRHARPPRCVRPIRPDQACPGALRVGISARLAKQALADAFALDVEQVEEVWHGLKPPYSELFDWGEGGDHSPLPRMYRYSGRSCLRIRWKRTAFRSTNMPPNGNGTAFEFKWSMQAGKPASTAEPGTISGSFPDIASAFSTAAVLDGELLVRGDVQAALPPASMRCSNGSAGRSSARSCRANIRPSSGSTTYCSTAPRICGRWPGPSAGRGWRHSCLGSIRTGSICPA